MVNSTPEARSKASMKPAIGGVKLAVAAACVLLNGCRAPEFMVANLPNAFSRLRLHTDLAYGSEPRQRLDIVAPRQGTNRPVVIFWYGGSWIQGRKADYRFVGVALAKQGFVAVLPDYRLYPKVTFPMFDEDGARAVAWVQRHVSEYGGDPTHVVLMGHSAGGHTAAFLAFNHEFLRKYGADPDGIAGLIGLSGTYVFTPDSDTLRAAFPPPYSVKDWQPIRFVDSKAPPTLLLHGLADRDVLPQEAIELRDALMKVHVPVTLDLFPRRGHADTVASFAVVTRWRTPALEEAAQFVRAVSGAAGQPH
jgi:acetyl esterase/lipase